MTNKEKIELVNKLLREVSKDENENDNYNHSSFKFLEILPVCLIVDWWYTHLEPEIFTNEEGIEIDEFLTVEEYRF